MSLYHFSAVVSLIGVFTVPGAQFPLTQVLDAVPNARVEIDRLVPTGDRSAESESEQESESEPEPEPEEAVFVFWAEADGSEALDDFETYLRHEESVRNLVRLDAVDDQRLYRLRWRVGSDDLVAPLVTLPGEFLSGVGTADACQLVVRFPEEGVFEEFVDWCERHNVPVEKAKRYTADSLATLGEDGHAELLSTLFEAGAVEEGDTLDDLAAVLGVSTESLPDGIEAVCRKILTSQEE